MIVTIDGPAGSGKSSTAKEVARRLGFRHLDSGAFYRALTWAAYRAGIPEAHWDALDPAELDALGVQALPAQDGWRMFLGQEDISEPIRSPEVNARVSLMARVPAVRGWLMDRLRGAARDGSLVTDGRDMGSVVFPGADLKVFLVADPLERARRRLAERGQTSPTDEGLRAEAARLLERDRIDSQRAAAPLVKPEGAVEIDTTGLTFEAQVEDVVRLARMRM